MLLFYSATILLQLLLLLLLRRRLHTSHGCVSDISDRHFPISFTLWLYLNEMIPLVGAAVSKWLLHSEGRVVFFFFFFFCHLNFSLEGRPSWNQPPTTNQTDRAGAFFFVPSFTLAATTSSTLYPWAIRPTPNNRPTLRPQKKRLEFDLKKKKKKKIGARPKRPTD